MAASDRPVLYKGEDIRGNTYGSWTVVCWRRPRRFLARKGVHAGKRLLKKYALFRCKCGSQSVQQIYTVTLGVSRSCKGCASAALASAANKRLAKIPCRCCGRKNLKSGRTNHLLCVACQRRGYRNGKCTCGLPLYKTKPCPCGVTSG